MTAVHDGTATRIVEPRNPDTASASPLVVETSRARRDDPAANPVAVIPGSAAALLGAMTQAVSLNHVDMDKVERLFAMQKEIRAQEALAAYNNAMSRAQSQMHTIVHDRANEHTRSRYATRGAINKVIVPIYTAEGLSVEFRRETKNESDPIPTGHIRVVARVAHSAGHVERHHEDFPLDDAGAKGNVNKTPIQATGSTKEYGMRYMLKGIFNLATGEEVDDDGNRQTGGRQQSTAGRTETNGNKKPYTDSDLDKYLPQWKAAGQIEQKVAFLKARFIFSDAQMKRIEEAKQ